MKGLIVLVVVLLGVVAARPADIEFEDYILEAPEKVKREADFVDAEEHDISKRDVSEIDAGYSRGPAASAPVSSGGSSIPPVSEWEIVPARLVAEFEWPQGGGGGVGESSGHGGYARRRRDVSEIVGRSTGGTSEFEIVPSILVNEYEWPFPEGHSVSKRDVSEIDAGYSRGPAASVPVSSGGSSGSSIPPVSEWQIVPARLVAEFDWPSSGGGESQQEGGGGGYRFRREAPVYGPPAENGGGNANGGNGGNGGFGNGGGNGNGGNGVRYVKTGNTEWAISPSRTLAEFTWPPSGNGHSGNSIGNGNGGYPASAPAPAPPPSAPASAPPAPAPAPAPIRTPSIPSINIPQIQNLALKSLQLVKEVNQGGQKISVYSG